MTPSGLKRTLGAWAGVALACAAAGPTRGEVRFFGEAAGGQVRVLSWRDIPFRTVVRQQYDYSCGSAALATLLTYHYGRPTSERDAFTEMYAKGDRARIRKLGFSMLDMKRYLIAQGLPANGYRMTLAELAGADEPLIALVKVGAYRHFVVVKGIQGDRILIGDPALGLKIVPKQAFAAAWNGVVLAVGHEAGRPRGKFNLAAEWSPWASAPVGAAARPDTVTTVTANLPPLYQITPMRALDLTPGG